MAAAVRQSSIHDSLLQQQSVPVGVAHHSSSPAILQRYDPGRYESRTMPVQRLHLLLQGIDSQREVDVDKVVVSAVSRHGSPGRRRAIIEELDAGSVWCDRAQAGDPHDGIEG